MTKWTPGPWFADTTPGWDVHAHWPRYRVVALMGDPREGEYLMNVMYAEDDSGQPYDAQAAANAHLMAAAPKLYDALAFAKSTLKSGEPWTAECERVIDGALAKARGEGNEAT